jgi:hypothetical protein
MIRRCDDEEKNTCPLCPERRGTQRPLQNQSQEPAGRLRTGRQDGATQGRHQCGELRKAFAISWTRAKHVGQEGQTGGQSAAAGWLEIFKAA